MGHGRRGTLLNMWALMAAPPNSTAGHGGFGATAVFIVLTVFVVTGTVVTLVKRRGGR